MNTKNVTWRDLTLLKKHEVIGEILLPLPWFIFTLYFLYIELFLIVGLSAFFFFITGLRLSHNAQHYVTGCSRKKTELILFILSPLMMNSMHAVQVTHLRHHKFCLHDEDTEGTCARMTVLQCLFYGPLFTIRMHRDALKYGTLKQQQWIKRELFTEGLLILCALTFAPDFICLYVALMITANCLTAFFCVWLVHNNTQGLIEKGRTIRNYWLNRLTFNMFLHVEHHMFPMVPTKRLWQLAARIDKARPEIKEQKVF